MINLAEVGAHVTQQANGDWEVYVGLYLPNISADKGYEVIVRIIHERDQFIRRIEPKNFPLTDRSAQTAGLWNMTVNLTAAADGNFGQAGKYLYRFQLLRNGEVVAFWFADPFAFDMGLGTLSAFTVGSATPQFAWTDQNYSVPDIHDLVVYELHVGEFNRTFDGVSDQLDYLKGLGVNAIEFMPITAVKESVEWGYTPLGYFTPDYLFGGVEAFKRLVDNCHARDIAVILDAVYAHAHPEFAYNLVYLSTGERNPMMGIFQGEFFSDRPGTDYSLPFTRGFFLAVNQHWLQEYHVDGFRYDYVPGFYDGALGQGYAKLVYDTYQHSKQYARFQTTAGYSKIIQCAEHLPDPQGIVSNTYSNSCWQNQLFDKAWEMARYHYVDASFAFLLDPQLTGYPLEYQNPSTQEHFPVAPFQYIESHDHSRFITVFGTRSLTDPFGYAYGNRELFYKTQPYVIALYTGKGIPMLWQGQEFAENWSLPDGGLARNLVERLVHWEYFYDRPGRALIRLYRILGELRQKQRALRGRDFYYYNDGDHLRKGVIAFRRDAPATAESIIVVLNFSDLDAWVDVEFGSAGSWSECLDQPTMIAFQTTQGATVRTIRVASNYGAVYVRQ